MYVILRSVLLISVFLSAVCIFAQEKNMWNGLEAPGLEPELFPVFMANENDNKHSVLSFSPDGKEIFYSVYVNSQAPQKIFHVKFDGQKWSKPVLAEFSGLFPDGGPKFSMDGKKIYFYSERPLNSKDSINSNYDIWYVEKINEFWSQPLWAGNNLNSAENEKIIEIASDGSMIIFTYDDEKNWRLYQSKLIDGVYQKRELIKIMSDRSTIYKPVTNVERDFIIIEDNVKVGKYYNSYLFISVLKDNGEWTEFTDMGKLINEGEGRFPSFSPDGKYFFFTSYRTGKAEYYWVDANLIYHFIEKMKRD